MTDTVVSIASYLREARVERTRGNNGTGAETVILGTDGHFWRAADLDTEIRQLRLLMLDSWRAVLDRSLQHPLNLQRCTTPDAVSKAQEEFVTRSVHDVLRAAVAGFQLNSRLLLKALEQRQPNLDALPSQTKTSLAGTNSRY